MNKIWTRMTRKQPYTAGFYTAVTRTKVAVTRTVLWSTLSQDGTGPVPYIRVPYTRTVRVRLRALIFTAASGFEGIGRISAGNLPGFMFPFIMNI